MKRLLLCSISAAVTLAAAPAMAQSQGATGQGTAAGAQADPCTRLINWVHQNPENDTGLSVNQLRRLQQQDDQQQCRQIMVQAGWQADAEGRIIVQQSSPSVRIDQVEPRITVRQSQPNVAVTQPQPQITVRQPAPQVTVNIPQPEIIVRMPEPNVQVSQSEPEVQVAQPQPQVQVIQPEQQPRVLMEQDQQPEVRVLRAQEEANVELRSGGQPTVRYEAEEPQVRIQREQGEPTVRYEQSDASAAQDRRTGAGMDGAAAQRTQQGFRAADQAVDEDRSTGAVADQGMTMVRISDLSGMDVYNAQGNQLGDVERVVVSETNDRMLAILAHGGFLGLGEKRVAVPLDSMAIRDDRFVVRGLTDDDIRNMPEWRDDMAGYRGVDGNQQTEVQQDL